MEKHTLIDAINFFNEISVSVEDITTPENQKNKNKVVIATYGYKGKSFKTKPLYYREISDLENVRKSKSICDYFEDDVYWLDIEKHKWPKGSGESDLDAIVVNDMVNGEDKDFRAFLGLLANNKQSGYIQKITEDGRPAQYYHNLENNNHWHDLVIWIKKTIDSNGKNIDKSFFRPIVFNWARGTGKRTPLNAGNPYKIVTDLNSNIEKAYPKMNFEKIKNLLLYKKQIILQGPPGTGKTRAAKRIARGILGLSEKEGLKKTDQCKLIQFHPSYTYEDFVRGISAKPNENGEGIVYEAENKILGRFAKKAADNYKAFADFKKGNDVGAESAKSKLDRFIDHIIKSLDESENQKYAISEKIYIFYVDDKKFKYKGDDWTAHPNGLNMNFSELEKIIESGGMDRSQITKLQSLNGLTRSHATYYANVLEKYQKFIDKNPVELQSGELELKNYVLIIDEINRANLSAVLGELIYALEYRNEPVESMYEVGSNELILPPNLYIIGTMNTADRSVGHIDYAVRRRFAFVDILPKELQDDDEIYFNSEDYGKVAALFNENVSAEFKKEDVQIGHSYFIAKKEEATDEVKRDDIFNLKMKYEVIPLLKEYVNDGILVGKFEGKDISEHIGSFFTAKDNA